MAILVYKQRFKPPNRKNTAELNAAHVEYIATRPRVYLDRDGEHGLFSNVTSDLDEAKRLIREKSKERKNIYRAIISFSRDTADNLELASKAEWEMFLKAHVRRLAEGNEIRWENFRWFAAAHNEGDHPHVHVIFWDDAQTVMKNFVPPDVPNGIRVQLIREVFGEQLRELEQRNMTFDLALEVLAALNKSDNDARHKMSLAFGRDLSKQAKREKAIEARGRGEWEG
ncbi:hypothetical protein FACS1894202_11410 [Clostridia bacterium]|nr:hypothetical protein FACS1894202_11410 [Clostridia bacterium]